MILSKVLFAAAILIAAAPLLQAAGGEPVRTDPSKTKGEYGAVRWYTNLDDGIALAKESNKPIFLQFQEVPG